VGGGDADVKGINRRLPRERASPNQLASEASRFVGDGKRRNAAQRPQSAKTCSPVADASLVPNDLRDE
jgi:hypothetical protein